MHNVHILSVPSTAISTHSSDLTVYRTDEIWSTKIKNLFLSSGILISPLQSLKHRAFCTLLILCYLFSLSIGLSDGEPPTIYVNTSSTSRLDALSKFPLSETVNSHKPHRRETDQGESIGDSDDEITIDYIIQHITTVGPEQRAAQSLHERNQSNLVQGNTASVIASSFRNIDIQTVNSKEAGEVPPSEVPIVKKKTRTCQRDALKKCVDGLPPMNDTGIPTSPEAVDRACRIYDSGINCFDSWAKNCLPANQRQLVRQSITGAHEMFSFLCKDLKFRADYLKHKECFKILSPYWDDCSRQFIEGLRRNIRNNYTAFCCIRLEFVTCVSKYSSRLCTWEATKFSMKMAETLIRTRTRPPIPDCIHIHPQNCIPMIENMSVQLRMHLTCILFALAYFILH